MTSKSYDQALDFLPVAPATTSVPARLLSGFKAFVAAISDGLEAQHQYKLRTSRGVSSAAAAKAVFDKLGK